MLNRVWRCYTSTLYVCISQLASPLPYCIVTDGYGIGQVDEQTRHKDGGAGVERYAHVTVYIYFSLCPPRSQSLSVSQLLSLLRVLPAYASLFVSDVLPGRWYG